MKSKVSYTVHCSCNINLYFNSNTDFDRVYSKAIGRNYSNSITTRYGSGVGFGEREFDWCFKTESDARKAVKKIRACAKKLHHRVRVSISKYDRMKFRSTRLR